MNLAAAIIVACTGGGRLLELKHAARNTAVLLSKGGVEFGREHYPLIVAMHAGWLVAVLILTPAERPISWPLLGLFVTLQLFRIWVIRTLGPWWTTRVIRVAGAPIIRSGPYRYCRHPNYVVVSLEIAVLPLIFGLRAVAVVFSILNALLLAWRIHIESAALIRMA